MLTEIPAAGKNRWAYELFDELVSMVEPNYAYVEFVRDRRELFESEVVTEINREGNYMDVKPR
ncbi:hypothetical protein A5698_22895 [Mycobacterium sp. E136]|nr:hypothetical protein A5698_22895 [Mycobacterium sp. E136]